MFCFLSVKVSNFPSSNAFIADDKGLIQELKFNFIFADFDKAFIMMIITMMMIMIV